MFINFLTRNFHNFHMTAFSGCGNKKMRRLVREKVHGAISSSVFHQSEPTMIELDTFHVQLSV